MNEFSLIQNYFYNQENSRLAQLKNIVVPNGDDGAVFETQAGMHWVSSMDTLIAGVHFPEDSCAADIAYKALSVNLSDLAAMGAAPHSFSMSLTLPDYNESWLTQFSESLFSLANEVGIVLTGGDTSKGPLSITVHVLGEVAEGQALTRHSAQLGDSIVVTGHLGLAALGLKNWQEKQTQEQPESESAQRFNRPEARLAFGQKLWSLGARCAIDISDGLLSEITHLCNASQLSADIKLKALPVHKEFASMELEQALQIMATGGDDYELCFALPRGSLRKVEEAAESFNLEIAEIGVFTGRKDKVINELSAYPIHEWQNGYKHF